MLPDLSDNGGQIHQLAVGAGKDSIIYVVDRNAMGKFHSTDTIYQEILGALAGSVFSTPAYFNQTIYYGAVSDAIKAFTISNARLGTSPSSRTSITFTYPGATPSVSANGTGSAILWAVGERWTASSSVWAEIVSVKGPSSLAIRSFASPIRIKHLT